MITPRITFVVPCHNSGEYLERSIDSIFSQSGKFDLHEIIISDDRSTDPNTITILNQLKMKERIKVIDSNCTPGPGGARNCGALHVETEWLSFLDSDDILLDEAIQIRLDTMQYFPDAKFIGADFQLWWPEPNKLDSPFFESRERPKKILKSAFENDFPIRLKKPVKEFIDATLTCSGTSLIKTKLFQEVGGYEESIRYCEDHHLWIKLARLTDFIFVPKSVMLYRQHEENMTNITTPPSQLYTQALLLLSQDNDFADFHPYINKKLSQLFSITGLWHRTQGSFSSGASAALKGIIKDPTNNDAWKQFIANLIHKP